ncbi:hypothetical protein Dxin01_00188 [Deinococcus xinjiangensis]|uniref:Uncharacterized protein n=1 Tax=Deinococcus xinjiangensis TaxID=457454 RepID=A0ABP9V9V4_9DEIO
MTNTPENLLFSVVQYGEEASATEALFSFVSFEPSSTVKPRFPENAVGKAIPVMTEGKFYVRQGDKYREVNFGAEDIKRLASKQPRDVPFNYDHKRASGEEGVKGWLRFGRDGESGQDLSYVGEITARDGSKLTALFATPELSQEAQNLITRGIYRDVSVEYRSLDDVLTGCALTSYPVMRNLQFSELEQESITPTLEQEDQPEEEMDLSKLTKEQKTELMGDLLSAAGVEGGLQGLVSMGEELKSLREQVAKPAVDPVAAKTQAMNAAEVEINKLVGDAHFGLTDEIATDAQNVLAWTSLQSDLKFGEDDTPDVGGAVRGLLGVIGKQAKQIALLGGQTVAKGEDGSSNFGELDPNEPDPELDEDRVSTLAAIGKRFLK